MRSKREIVRHVVYVVVFLAISAGLYLFFTYLYREVRANSRRIITGYYSQDRDTVDVVAVGGSGLYRFFDTMLCYREEGFTSYDFCVASMPGVSVLPAIQDAMRTQKPKVLLIDAKRFAPARTRYRNKSIRNVTDSMPMGPARSEAISRYTRMYRTDWSEQLAMHLDLLLYHNNTRAITEKAHWDLADNRWNQLEGTTYFNGFGPSGGLTPIDVSKLRFGSKRRGRLSRRSEELLRETLEYCRGLDCEVVFVVTPGYERQQSINAYNTMGDLCREYGVSFFNGEKLQKAMGIDYERDFYDLHHTNAVGACKFTRYFVNWLKKRVELPDHRGDPAYRFYDQLLAQYETFTEKCLRLLARKMLRFEQIKEAGDMEAYYRALTDRNPEVEDDDGESGEDSGSESGGTEDSLAGDGTYPPLKERAVKARVDELHTLIDDILSNRYFKEIKAARRKAKAASADSKRM